MMRDLIKKITSLVILFALTASPILASQKINAVANVQQDFSLLEVPEEIYFKTAEDFNLTEEITIPAFSMVEVEIMQAEQERRWHKSGAIVGKLKSYTPEEAEKPIDISENNIYFLIRKYEALNKKEAEILSTEIILTQTAGIVGSCFIVFAPVDIAYFFTKGAIQRYKYPENRFKAGVSCAYDNSIFWFWLKGKPIDLAKDDTVRLKGIKERKAQRMSKGMQKRNNKRAIKAVNNLCKKEVRAQEKELKLYARQINANLQNDDSKFYEAIDKEVMNNNDLMSEDMNN